MKKLIYAMSTFLLVMLLNVRAEAQTRVLVGAESGSSFGNLFLGAQARVEVPFARRYELDLGDTFSPLESHIVLGHGWSNQVSAGGHYWITQGFGLNGRAEYSNYSVTQANKGLAYAFGGVTFRKVAWGSPARFSLDYIREFNNGISANGTESSHLQGGEFQIENRLGCSKNMCFRLGFDFEAGHVLNQGNPMCDGTFAEAVSCPRTQAWAGSFIGSFLLEFPRRQGHENETF
jgi:hypothetical protein